MKNKISILAGVIIVFLVGSFFGWGIINDLKNTIDNEENDFSIVSDLEDSNIESSADGDDLAVIDEEFEIPVYRGTAQSASSTTDNKFNFERLGLNVDNSKSEINQGLIASGGPAKDGIPALTSPEYIGAEDVGYLMSDDLGLLYEHEGVIRFYPTRILTWHEIVNDSMKDHNYAVTYCPLCGSYVVYDRDVEGEVLEFGVSGLLYESNLLMYDRSGNESLWSQAEGRAVVGERVGTELSILPSNLLTWNEVKDIENLEALSLDTGYTRSYAADAYEGYFSNDELFSSVQNSDDRLLNKALMLVTNDGVDSYAVEWEKLQEVDDLEISEGLVIKKEGEGYSAYNAQGVQLPTYFTFWFSWANHHEVLDQ